MLGLIKNNLVFVSINLKLIDLIKMLKC